ncbi:MAG: amino acid permease [Burkholderiaceae bacterium]|jgi:amino acid transporter|nr:amino acid permease [Burkholderiaceae bacterium]
MNDAMTTATPDSRPTLPDNAPRPTLELRHAVALIVGIVIGAGIFKAPAVVAQLTGNAVWMFGVWTLGGLISFVGALCYAELATTYPSSGGDYHFLQRAYGKPLAFLFGWARLSVITTGSIAILAFVFGDYMNQVISLDWILPRSGGTLHACIAVLGLSWANLHHVRTGMAAQTWLTVLQVIGLFLIVGAAILLFGINPANALTADKGAPTSPEMGAVGLAMIFVLLTYGGWNEAAYISAEMKTHRLMVGALALSIIIITVLYLLVTWAYWQVLGLPGMAKSHTIAAEVMRIAMGAPGEKIISLIIAVATLTSINGTIIVGARTSYAIGKDWRILRKLGVWDAARHTPSNAIVVQCIMTLLLLAVGAFTGSGFIAMVEFTAPVFWAFFLLAGISLFVLRIREPSVPRPFTVPLYPLLPLVFCTSCAYMLWSSLSYVYSQSLGGLNAAWIGVMVMAFGIILFGLARRFSPENTSTVSQPLQKDP